MALVDYRRGRFTISKYRFTVGGPTNVRVVDFVNDPQQGLRVPAQSIAIKNHGGGSGFNYLYVSLAQAVSANGTDWDEPAIVDPDNTENYGIDDGMIIYGALIWASNANLEFSLRATPGTWTQELYAKYMPGPVVLSTAGVDIGNLSTLDKQAILRELALGG